MEQGSLRERDLHHRLDLFVSHRWLATAVVLVSPEASRWFLGITLDAGAIRLVALAMALYNAVFAWMLRGPSPTEGEVVSTRSKTIAHLQIAVDLIALTTLVHLTGGVTSPLAFFYSFHVIIASMLLGRKQSVAHTVLAVLLYDAAVSAEFAGVLTHYPFYTLDDHAFEPVFFVTRIAAFSSGMLILSYFATSISGRLRKREREVVALSQRLEATNTDLKRLNSLKTDFLATTSHDLKSPLAAVRGQLDLLAAGIPGPINEKQLYFIDKARTRIDGQVKLINELLDITSIETGAGMGEKVVVSPSAFVQPAAAEAQEEARSKGLQFFLAMADPLPEVCVVPARMGQVLSNLLGNAMKFTDEGGRIDLNVSADQDCVRFEVRDSGIGISDDEVGRIFDDFFRSRRNESRRRGGSGLGLSIVKRLVEFHEGHISVTSEPGRGSTFTVTIPALPGKRRRSV